MNASGDFGAQHLHVSKHSLAKLQQAPHQEHPTTRHMHTMRVTCTRRASSGSTDPAGEVEVAGSSDVWLPLPRSACARAIQGLAMLVLVGNHCLGDQASRGEAVWFEVRRTTTAALNESGASSHQPCAKA